MGATTGSKTLNILFGFEETKFQRTIERTLEGLGYEVNIVCRYSKNSVADFLHKNREFTHAVLKENFNRSKYSDVELAELADERELNIIVVLSKAHKGTPYMETLYAAGITGALFMENNSSDATVQNVSNLLINKRSRQEARKYYGIGEKVNIRLNSISDGKLSDLLQSLDDASYGENIGRRFAQLCTSLSPKQVVDFIRRMPMDTKAELEKYDDYWMVITALESHGVSIKSKKYQQGIKEFSKRARLKSAQEKVSIVDKDLEKEYVPKSKVYQPETAKQPEPVPVPEPPEDLYASIETDNSDLFEENRPQAAPQYAQQPQYATQQMMQQPMLQQTAQQPMPQQLPPTNDWRELKRREKEAKKQAKRLAKTQKYKRLETPLPEVPQQATPQQQMSQNPNGYPQFQQESVPVTNLHPKRQKDEKKKKELLIRLGILFAVIAFIGLIAVVSIGVSYMTKTNAMEQNKEQELLNEQMNDLAEIRSGQPIDITNVIPATAAVSNGDQLMGMQVMDVINTDMQLYYVINTDGSLYTYENGGATSNEIDVNSMYFTQMLSSGRFAFYQQ